VCEFFESGVLVKSVQKRKVPWLRVCSLAFGTQTSKKKIIKEKCLGSECAHLPLVRRPQNKALVRRPPKRRVCSLAFGTQTSKKKDLKEKCLGSECAHLPLVRRPPTMTSEQ
jgi:hypothetical protein